MRPKRPRQPGPSRRSSARPTGRRPKKIWRLYLYVAGQTPRSLTAFANLKRLCEAHLAGSYRIEVIDLMKNPALAQRDQIVAVPTLIKKLPAPMKRVIGDLSNSDRVQVGIDLATEGGAV